ncbi:PHD finger protein 7-like isoform X1 [Dromaius novaehollandiae]|uniref:PHD finger protein 7-like isoform X1 n=2 Tax=Dromaius novaehollandiae TaxID=8790 RepID=UPI00311E433F
MKRKAPDSSEKACMLCRRADVSAEVCGPTHREQGLCVHEFCLYLASGLEQRRTEREGICGFLPADIKKTIKAAARKSCFACGEHGAAIDCQGKDCSRSFHLPCASSNGCVTQFFKAYRSFCSEHRPEQAVPVRPDEETTCIICMERVDEKLSFGTLVCPACRGAWFHRGCIQGQASRAGRECFRCPQCKNKRKFLPEMLKMGIYVLFRPPAWEETGQYEELYERHSQCDAGQCLYREGRQQAQESGPWELLLCSSCASRGTHRHCSAVGAAVEAWECDGCAGIGPAPSALPEPSAPSTSSKPGAETSSSPAAPASAELDLASSSTSSKPGAEASSSSAAPASSKPDLASSITSTSSQDESEASSSSATPATSESDLVSSRAGSQEESGSSPGSPAPESSPQAGRPGPE